jgi:voltage-gated potassium channel
VQTVPRPSGITLSRPRAPSGERSSFPGVARPRVIERRLSRFLREPVSVRNAVSVIVGATTLVVVVGALLMRLLDRDEYSNLGRALWWAMQTVTTVGYGDVTPTHTSGRLVAAALMLWGVAFIAITTAAITSTFVARAAREREHVLATGEETEEQRLDARLDDLAARLERIEQALSRLAR